MAILEERKKKVEALFMTMKEKKTDDKEKAGKNTKKSDKQNKLKEETKKVN